MRFALIAKSASASMNLAGGCPKTSTHARRRYELRTYGCCRVVLLALALVAGAQLALAQAVRAAPISYMFSSNALAVLDGDKEKISGSFTFDSGTMTQTLVTITLTGASPLSGTYSLAAALMQFDAESIEANDLGGNSLLMAFATPLAGIPDSISNLVYIPMVLGTATVRASALNGEALPFVLISIPEPSGLNVLSVALGLFLLIARANRRDRRTPDQSGRKLIPAATRLAQRPLRSVVMPPEGGLAGRALGTPWR
jgi:hypothetical protein